MSDDDFKYTDAIFMNQIGYVFVISMSFASHD